MLNYPERDEINNNSSSIDLSVSDRIARSIITNTSENCHIDTCGTDDLVSCVSVAKLRLLFRVSRIENADVSLIRKEARLITNLGELFVNMRSKSEVLDLIWTTTVPFLSVAQTNV